MLYGVVDFEKKLLACLTLSSSFWPNSILYKPIYK